MVMRATSLINEIRLALFHRCALVAAIFLHSFFEILRVKQVFKVKLLTKVINILLFIWWIVIYVLPLCQQKEIIIQTIKNLPL